MIALLIAALLPLDASGADESMLAGGLRLDAVVEGRRVSARLTNGGSAPLEVLTGFTCGGPQPFTAVVDGVERPFQTGVVVCTRNAMVSERLAPGRQLVIASRTIVLDGSAHRVKVRYRSTLASTGRRLWQGSLTSAPVPVEPAALDVVLRAVAGRAPGTIDVTIDHRWSGPTALRFLTAWAGACAGPNDTLIFTDDDLRPLGIKGNIGDWTGDRESPEVSVTTR